MTLNVVTGMYIRSTNPACFTNKLYFLPVFLGFIITFYTVKTQCSQSCTWKHWLSWFGRTLVYMTSRCQPIKTTCGPRIPGPRLQRNWVQKVLLVSCKNIVASVSLIAVCFRFMGRYFVLCISSFSTPASSFFSAQNNLQWILLFCSWYVSTYMLVTCKFPHQNLFDLIEYKCLSTF